MSPRRIQFDPCSIGFAEGKVLPDIEVHNILTRPDFCSNTDGCFHCWWGIPREKIEEWTKDHKTFAVLALLGKNFRVEGSWLYTLSTDAYVNRIEVPLIRKLLTLFKPVEVVGVRFAKGRWQRCVAKVRWLPKKKIWIKCEPELA